MTSTLKVDELQNSLGGSGVKVGSLKHPDASGTNVTLASDGSATINQISSSSVLPAGHIIQTVAGTKATSESTTGNSEIFTGLAASITISAGNKVLIMVSQNFRLYATGSSSGRYHNVKLRRGTDATTTNNTLIFTTGDNAVGLNGSGTGGFGYVAGITYVDDNPGAGTHQYRTSMVTTNNTYQITTQAGGGESFMVLMEIKA